ncbi:MAG: hypothetical protein WCL50_07060 [Spirochaetota bacterium]
MTTGSGRRSPLRYAEDGEVHKDFHLATDTSISWILGNYGESFLAELFRRTAEDVYADIHRRLKMGDGSELVAHWRYFLEREGGVFDISEENGATRLHVRDCPAARHLQDRGRSVSREFHLQTSLMNEAWSRGTPFEISTELLGDCECLITLRRRADAAE